ncbi:MAG: hypothetical protein NC131_07215 [Roseburia sp.]|nr:hypothetical protein [Roseburia sp.]
MKTEANHIINTVESWSKADRENRAAAVCLSDRTSGNYYIHYAGHSGEIGKCVHAIMCEDPETAFAIFAAVTVFAHKNFPAELIASVNTNAARIAALREQGKSDDEIRDIMLNE